MKNQVSEYIRELISEDSSRSYSCDMTSSSVHQVHAPIPTDLFHELKALAAVYKRDANCVAGDLLTLALQDAMNALPAETRAHLQKVREAYEKEEVAHLMESVEYDAGGT